ncbi:hypothetical protein J4422_02665 [Candidatus Pacearchaeota archaeon]|nr:hypothetical protein [Candidatus Pacearchaeota archaeon]
MANGLEKHERSILNKIHEKGWEVYDSTNAHTRDDAEKSIRKGPTRILENGKRYVLLPKTKSPKDPKVVFSTIEEIVNREPPTISIDGERFPWTGFIPYEDHIKVNTNVGHFISYENFLSSIASILQV